MSEQVKQLGAPGLGEFIDWAWALKEERDALHAEAEALREERDSFQRVGIRAMKELEAARGLLEKSRLHLKASGHNLAADDIGRHLAENVTPAPEVQAEQGERQGALPIFTCSGKGGEYAKLGYAKPAGAIKAIQGDSGLIVYRDTKSGQLYFRDPRDFKDRMSPLAVMEPCSIGGDVIRQRTTADTTPQPGPDVRVMVSADDVRDACANAVSVFAEDTNADQCREVAEYMREVLLAQIAHRQAQQGDSHES